MPSRVVLINMPFGAVEMPSIALTQIKGVLERQFGADVVVEILYLNLDFVTFMDGLSSYRLMVSSQGRMTGLADWFFRGLAFPEAKDNTPDYLARFYFDEDDEETRQVRALIEEKRPNLAPFLDSLIDQYRLSDADIVGFSCLFYQTMASFALARRIKDCNPEVTTTMGGAACETVMGMEYARQVKSMDFVFSGPALVSFPDFVQSHLTGHHDTCDQIPGVFSKRNLEICTEALPRDPKLAFLPDSGKERNINDLAELDYHGFLDRFEATFPDRSLKPTILFETSRGCSWGEKIACSFCGLNGTAMQYRQMSAEQALKVINGLFSYVPRCNFFLAVDTIVPGNYFEEVFPSVRPPRGTALMYEVRSTLDTNQLRTLSKAGVHVIQPGIEALATPTLKLMRKGATAFSNLRFLKACSRFPFRVEWNLLIGSPGEEEETYRKYLQDLPLLMHLPPPGGAFPISFDRYSHYFNEPDSFGLDLHPREFYGYVFPFEDKAVRNVAYHFVDRKGDQERLETWLDQLNKAIEQWWLRWRNSDQLEEAQLQVLEDGEQLYIYDSRAGTAHYEPIKRDLKEILEYLETPRNWRQTISRFGEARAGKAREFLHDSGFVFEEEGRVMSLVIL